MPVATSYFSVGCFAERNPPGESAQDGDPAQEKKMKKIF